MIINNGRGKRAFVNQLVADQIKIENRFAPKVATLLREIGKDATNYYISTRSIVPTHNFIPQMITLLRTHYRRVIPKFGFFIRNQLGIKNTVVPETKNINDDFAMESTVYINNHSEEQANIIMGNYENELERTVSKALVGLLLLMEVPNTQIEQALSLNPSDRRSVLQSMVDSNTTFSQQKKNQELRRLLNREMRKAASGRSRAIAITETNNPINFAMEKEAELALTDPEVIAAAAAAGIALNTSRKEWVAVLDSRTRETHVHADGQQVGLGETFDVGGYRMRFPTDSSLGAPAGEIINCRCKSIPVTGNE